MYLYNKVNSDMEFKMAISEMCNGPNGWGKVRRNNKTKQKIIVLKTR